MKIAITGARGRLGKELRQYFEQSGHEVIGFSRNPDAAHQPLNLFGRMLENSSFDAVLHLAWSTVPSTAEIHPGVEWREDLPLLSAMLSELDTRRVNGASTPRLLFLSSCSVYGEAAHDGVLFDETCTLRPIGWYARAKAQAEGLILAFAERGNSSVVLRVTNPYGFVQDARCLQGVIPAMIRAARQGGDFTMWGGDCAVKDYLHVSDFCRAVDIVLRGGLHGTYNVASGHSVSLRDLIASVERITGLRVIRKESPAAAWDVRNGRYSHKALTDATGWTPRVDLAEGLTAFLDSLGETQST
jgi:UDP-glucose 4-epimerase